MYDLGINAPIELINIVPFNPLISKCQIKVCWVGDTPNRNKSIITKSVAREMANSLPGSPIVGYYNEASGDFEEHNKIIEIAGGKFRLKPTTRPYGFVDLGAKVWFQWFLDPDGVQREYLVTEGWLWTGQFPECQRVVEEGNNQSMELSEDPNYLNAHWTKDRNGNKQFFIINEAIISKLCILGEEYEPCFESGSITAPKMEFSFEDDFKEQLFSMMTEIKNILKEGGAFMANTENTPVVETPVVEEPVVETPVVEEPTAPAEEPVVEEPTVVEEPAAEEPVVAEEPETEEEASDDEEPSTEFAEEKCPECGKPVAECTCEEDKPAKYVLEEIPEYVELQSNYANLETQHNELLAAHEALKAEHATLVSFKADVEKKEKEAMIKSFYMLSDDDKKDVIDNIDTYSLGDIEAKLSILCVRNKVSFDLEENKEEEPTTYGLNIEGSSDNNVPEWIKAVQAVTKEN